MRGHPPFVVVSKYIVVRVLSLGLLLAVPREELLDHFCNLMPQGYRYRADLAALDACRPGGPLAVARAPVRTVLTVPKWTSALQVCPDAAFGSYIVRGLTEGFRIGYDYQQRRGRGRRNLASAAAHPREVDAYLTEELARGRVVGPLRAAVAQTVHTSPFGVIPKSGKPGRWRLILDLSAPLGASINTGISPELSSIRYARVEHAVRALGRLGPGALMAKVDLKSAYRVVPVHPDDHHLLGMAWRGGVYLDTALPFGLRSAPKIFSAVADALLWSMYEAGLTFGLHYLDDFFFAGRAHEWTCHADLSLVLLTCARLGVPVATDKVKGPIPVLTFLGIQLDSVAGCLRLPARKLERLKSELARPLCARAVSKRNLLSVIGLLHHAATVNRSGRAFLRRLINLSMVPRHMDHYVRLNKEARADLRW